MELKTELSLDACRTALKTGLDGQRDRETVSGTIQTYKPWMYKHNLAVCTSTLQSGLWFSDLRGAPSAISKAVMPRDQRSL